MGTNYYMRYNICTCCDRYDEWHIGKSSGGWVFSFHGPETWERNDPDEGLTINGIFIEYPTTKAEWEFVLDEPNISIFDEYGNPHTVESFWELVEAKQKPTNKHHAELHPRPDRDGNPRNWSDPEGYSFSAGEFC